MPLRANKLHPFLLVTLSLLFACSGGGSDSSQPPVNPTPPVPTNPAPPPPQTLDGQLNLLADTVGEQTAGMAIQVIQNNEVVYQANRGLANVAADQAISSDTGFRIASISKTFTALALMQLYERGLVDLQESILTYLPELPESWQTITLHHLLSHRSGIPDYINDVAFSFWPDEVTAPVVMAYFVSGPDLEFTPGVRAEYSNSGYVIIAEVVARVSQRPFSDYMDQFIFTPFGMQNSYILDSIDKRRPSDAINLGNSDLIFNKFWLAPGASGQVSSSSDFVAFFTAFKNNEIVTHETRQLMTQTYSNNIFGRGYGYGFLIDSGEPGLSGHGGLLGGFVTDMQIHTANDWEVIVLSNNGNGGLVAAVTNTVNTYFSAP